MRLESVTMSYRARDGDYTAVSDVDLTVERGRFVSVVGLTGCGKSTLLGDRKTLQWIEQHSPEEIADKMLPEYAQGNRKVYVASIARAKEPYSKDGAMQADGAEAVQAVLAQFIPEAQQANIDLAKTYTNDYLPGKAG